jgi:hypothetical protein
MGARALLSRGGSGRAGVAEPWIDLGRRLLMKKKPAKTLKLTLDRETLRTLETSHLKEAAAGVSIINPCSVHTCNTCPTNCRKC